MSQFHLIVPTRNRPVFLKRLLEYYVSVGLDYCIEIVDSSDSDQAARVEKIVATYDQGLDLSLRTFPADMPLMVKMAEAVKLCESDLVCFCADDDFLMLDSLRSAVQKMESHSAWSAVQGLELSFDEERGVEDSLIRRSQPDLSSSDPGARLKSHLQNYRPTFYAVHRTKQLAKALVVNAELFQGDIFFGELLPSCITAIQGEVRRFNWVYDVREKHPAQEHRNLQTHGEYIIDTAFADKYSKFRGCLVEFLCEAGVSVEQAESTVKEATLAYFSTYMGYLHANHGWRLPYKFEAITKEERECLAPLIAFFSK